MASVELHAHLHITRTQLLLIPSKQPNAFLVHLPACSAQVKHLIASPVHKIHFYNNQLVLEAAIVNFTWI
jgi:hypothetical protein